MVQIRNGFVLFFLVFVAFQSHAQTATQEPTLVSPQDTLISQDTTAILADSTSAADSGNFSGSVPLTVDSDINTTINYQAKDSIDFDVVNRVIYLYGAAKVDYGAIKLNADFIEYNYGTSMLLAHGVPDSTGKVQGKPLFQDGDASYVTDSIRYNFLSRKALISGVVTEQGEGYIQADRVKRMADGSAAMGHVAYTTCNLAEPHFHIEANKIKMLPGDKIISGPFHLEVANIPTPLGFLFGMFPVPKKNEAGSGIIIPKYGEENRRGFFLRDGGYYFAISDYLDASLTGSIYSKGSYTLNLNTRYKKRYSYGGNVNLQYSNQRVGDQIEDTLRSTDIWLRWSHSPETRGNSRLSANVNAGTSGFNTINPNQNLSNTLRQEFNSAVTYSTTFLNNRLNFSTNFRLNQNVRTKKADILLPEVALGMNRIYPFKKVGSSGKTWYEKINMAWTFNATNRLTNVLPFEASDGSDSIASFSAESLPIIIRNGNNGARHSIPVSTSFNLFKHITVSPSLNFTEYWYLKELDWRYDAETNSSIADTVRGFSRAFAYNTSASFTSRLYGTFNAPKGSWLNEKMGLIAVRHVLIPSVGLSYRPNFSNENYGIYKEVLTDSVSGNTQLRSRYEGFIFGSPGAGQSGVISFSLNNNFEMKVRDKADSTGEGTTKLPILENLQFTSSYNILADSFRLAPIRISTRTKLFNNKVNINFQTMLDPYTYRLDTSYYNAKGALVVEQTKLDRFTWNSGEGLGNITSARVAISTRLSPKGATADGDRTTLWDRLGRTADNYREEDIQDILDNPDTYLDWSVPWSLSVNYNIDLSKVGYNEPTLRQTLRFNGDISISENWKITASSGYDIQQRKLIDQTNIAINRNLHCWELRFNWTPFGTYQSYSVDLQVKASLLQDLKLSRRRSWFDN